MKYKVVLWVTYSDETADKNSMYNAETRDEALASVWKYMGQYANGDTVASVVCMAMTNIGSIILEETWVVNAESAE